MSHASASPHGQVPIGNLQSRVERLHTQMSRSSTMTAVTGIVVVVLLTIYFNYAYNRIVEMTKPESVVMLADQLLIDNLPGTRAALQTQIAQSAPEWAGELSRQAVQSVPELRKGVESFVLAQIDQQLAEVELISDAEFHKLLGEHKDDLRRHARSLADNEKLPEESMKDFVATYDRHFAVSFQETTELLFDNLFNMNKNLLRLKANQGLTAEEQQQRRLIMLARAIQGQQGTAARQSVVRSAQGE